MAVLSLLLAGAAWGQSKYNVSGIIIEKDANEAVPGATVQVITKRDSAFVKGTATDLKGNFSIASVETGDYLLKISFIGYQTKFMPLSLKEQKQKKVDVGYITLSTDAVMLAGATVQTHLAQVQVKGDSLVYNASAYKLAAGSALEDLVKKLPGATMDSDGTIKINGKEVKKILVDGKEFFINDKSIALKNLPTDIIDKVKAYDRKSDLARITGIDDGEEETVLDVGIKKGKNNGWFGELSGGVGTQSRYNERVNVNRFNGTNQYSIVMGANNVGDSGFGGGGGRFWGGGGNGLRASKNVGFNFANETKDQKLQTGGHVFHRYNGSDEWNKSFTQNFVTSTGAFNNRLSQSFTSNASLNASLRFEWKPDTMTNIIFRPSGNYSRNRGSSRSESSTYNANPDDYDETQLAEAENVFLGGTGSMGATTDEDIQRIVETIVNTNRSRSQSYSNNKGLNGELQLNRKLNGNGRNVTLRLTGGLSESESKSLSASEVRYQPDKREPDTNNRYYTTPGRNRNYSVQATYSEPIAKRTYLQFSYRFNYRYTKSDRQAFTYDAVAYTDLVNALASHRYDIAGAVDELLNKSYDPEPNTNLSQFSEYNNKDHTFGLTLRVVRDKYNLSAGVEALPQHTELNYKYMGKEFPKVTQNVFNFTPTMRLRYKFNETSSLNFDYRGRTSQPSITNMLDITDDSDPLNIRKGNPDLKPSFRSDIRMFYNTYNAERQRGIFTHMSIQLSQNDISNRVSYNEETGVRTTRPENINGNWNVWSGFGINSALDKSKTFTINSFSNFGYTKRVQYLDPTQYERDKSSTNSLNLGQNLGFTVRYGDWLDVTANGNIDYSHSTNNVLANSNFNTFDFSYGLDATLTAPWGTNLSTDIAMNSRRGYSSDEMNTNELIWNAQISHSFLKGRALTVALEWNDILREQSNISRTIDAMQRNDSRYNAIYSYGMLRVIYKLNIFGGKNANGTEHARGPWGGGPGPRPGRPM